MAYPCKPFLSSNFIAFFSSPFIIVLLVDSTLRIAFQQVVAEYMDFKIKEQLFAIHFLITQKCGSFWLYLLLSNAICLFLENARFTRQRFQILEYLNQTLYLIGGIIRVLVGSWVLKWPWVPFFQYACINLQRHILDPAKYIRLKVH